MRELKFRAWDKKRKKMWYPNNDEVDFYAIGMSGALYALDENGKYDYTEEFEKMIFMQFTGLKDSKGKEIYEGDIVIADDGGEWFPHEYDEEKDEYYPTGKYLVEYDSEFARFILIDLETNCEVECDYNPFSLPDFTLEVIGNKFQNPELLKEVLNVN